MKPIQFTSEIEKIHAKGGWHYIRLPDEVRTELKSMTGKSGNVPVLVTVGKSTWQSTTMSMGQQRWFIAVKAEIRKAEVIAEGDTVSVSMVPDFDRLG